MIKTFAATDENLHGVLAFIDEQLEAKDCNMKTQMMIDVIVEEIFVNIAHYAYPNSQGDAIIEVDFDNNDLIVSFTDSGIPFNPLEKEDPDITASAEERDIGGLGIFMVKKTMDKVDYQRKDEKNILTIRKAII